MQYFGNKFLKNHDISGIRSVKIMIFREFIDPKKAYSRFLDGNQLVLYYDARNHDAMPCCRLSNGYYCHSSQKGTVYPKNLVVVVTIRIFAGS